MAPETPTRYYQILAFNHPEDIDNQCHTHIYPSYVSCMPKKGCYYRPFSAETIKEEPLMLQSNPHDALCFVETEYTTDILLKAVKTWPHKEFYIIPMDAMFFGRRAPRWVVNA